MEAALIRIVQRLAPTLMPLLLVAMSACAGEVLSGELEETAQPDAGTGSSDAGDGSDESDEPEEPAGGTTFLLPWTGAQSFRVSQGHGVGSHLGKGHFAWDFALPSGTPLRAAHDGVVRVMRGDSTIGGCDSAYANDANYVVVDRGDGLETLYLHLSSTAVSAGDLVARGDVIGLSGATGWACGAHLHFQIQTSPDGGGTASWYNGSVQEFFHDTGMPYDPPAGSEPVSANSQ